MENVTGILSNWDVIEAGIRSNLHTDYGQSKDISDILDIIHELQISAVTVSPLRTLFNEHVIDAANPHEVQILISDLDVIQVLYTLYTNKYGADLTLSEFSDTLIRIKKFATRADVDARVNLDKVMTPDVMEYIVDLHDVSPDAHHELFRHKLPGVPLESPPLCSLDPTLISQGQVQVDRNCSMNYHDINGRIQSVGINEMAIDHSYGVPAIPIFSLKRNILLYSKTIGEGILFGGARNPVGPFVVSPSDDQDFMMFQENSALTYHGFDTPISEPITGVQCYSVYVFPLDRRAFKITVQDNLGDDQIVARYNLNTEESESNVPVSFTSMQVYPNGWYRLTLSFDATGLNLDNIKINVMKQELNDDFGYGDYAGAGADAAVFYQHQLTQGSLPVPPIFTLSTPTTVLGTKITKAFSEYFNPIRGTLYFRYLSPLPEMFRTHHQYGRIFNSVTGVTVVTVATAPSDPSRDNISVYNNTGVLSGELTSDQHVSDDASISRRIAFTYTTGYQGNGFTDEAPRVFRLTENDTLSQMMNFFGHVYDSTHGGVVVAQLHGLTIPQDANDINDTLPLNVTDYFDTNRIYQTADTLEVGYSSVSDTYLEGYLLNLRYYNQFSNYLNIEFLMDQYIPSN